MKIIDLRSDTITRPNAAMRQIIAEARVGDDVQGEDPTVNRLEELSAEILGTEAAIFACSGTQTNLLALLSHCGRGDEYITGQQAHTYKYEAGGGAVLGSIQPQPIEFEPDGTLDLQKVKKFIKPDDFHFARTRLLCLENTVAGKVLPLDYLCDAAELVRKHDLRLHLDGARIFNAAVKLNVNVQEISRHFDSVSVCLSKGLGAPVGSVLCGSTELINQARRWRKMLGGGMRQAGILAAAGIMAITENVDRLADDHANTELLAAGLSEIPGINIDPLLVQTNMVFVDIPREKFLDLRSFLEKQGILTLKMNPLRLVTHSDVSTEDMNIVIKAFKDFFKVS